MNGNQIDDRISNFHAEIWLDEDESTIFPAEKPFLAHYTSMQNLESICKGAEIWLSHPYQMNDHQELAWAISEGMRRVTSDARIRSVLGPAVHPDFIGMLEVIRDVDSTSVDSDTYIGCFCRHADPSDRDGVLSMWRAYGANGGGAAIVFDTSKLAAVEASPLIIAPVHYLTTEERLAWIEQKITTMIRHMRLAPVDIHLARSFALNFYERLRMFSLFTKHVGFREENEWRVVYDPKRAHGPDYRRFLSYAVTGRGIEPKFKLPMDGSIHSSFVLDQIVDSVLLGPTAGTNLAIFATKRMLELLNRPRMSKAVYASATPLKAG